MAILTSERLSAVPETTTRAWRAVAAAIVAIAWGGNEFTPLLVMYKGNGLPLTAVDLLLFYYVLGIVPALLIGGPLSDRWGRRPLMLPAPLIAAAGSLLLAVGAASVPMLAAGRMLCGVALGLAMAVGGSWVKELSQASAAGSGARRSAMSLTAGFALGAGVAGLLAQWGPLPNSTAYLVNVALCLAAAVGLRRVPETVTRQPDPGRFRDDLKILAAGHRRFLRVAVPIALWLFTANATAYAVLPTLMLPRVQQAPIAFSALVTMVALGCGFLIQSVARRIDRPGTARAGVIALGLLTLGMVLAAWTAATLSVWVTLLAAVVLGSGYGIGLVAGLQQIERIAGPGDLAGLNAVFYSVSYLGFGVPAVLSALHGGLGFGYPAMYLVTALIAAACLALVAANYRERL
ncbi:major facilitator family transporter [Nocardia neocaledoniensis NBRC 108232]|uniref:Putative MFS family arabinose efflux permease n=1 Tax=Nocardia neocaledoniensis TaxID=236511 RepID=A0A317N186_9NOCA|nr:MFS transporter [Nocardia neocaledoniensis]PWV67700.1 putative MFS family arabinose efflux permease [Nocardia neocaledoniensis]GEM34412.1 major facilitator family transporter [Nocardia neocaledoniensis NBRC 108232]